MATKHLTAFAAAALLLSACATATQPLLDEAMASCRAGNDRACHLAPALAEQVTRERAVRDQRIAGAILLGLSAVALGVAAAHLPPPPPPPILVLAP